MVENGVVAVLQAVRIGPAGALFATLIHKNKFITYKTGMAEWRLAVRRHVGQKRQLGGWTQLSRSNSPRPLLSLSLVV